MDKQQISIDELLLENSAQKIEIVELKEKICILEDKLNIDSSNFGRPAKSAITSYLKDTPSE